jgi:hypothetical protein
MEGETIWALRQAAERAANSGTASRERDLGRFFMAEKAYIILAAGSMTVLSYISEAGLGARGPRELCIRPTVSQCMCSCEDVFGTS